MNNLQRAFEIFRDSLDNAHIPSITDDKNYHEDTEALYTLAFDFYHLSKEARQNMEIDDPVDTCEVAQHTYDLAEELASLIKDEIDANSNIGYDNILRGLAERSLAVCGKMKRYQREAIEDQKEEETEKPKPVNRIKVPNKY